ncbi:MAG: circularly permuted type 2 ATP-grasp protein [Alphaproteobacteria bacterium]|nr:circularly permuted type 2 ATP-grasp protein [Alphaproteobacteria bacterium]
MRDPVFIEFFDDVERSIPRAECAALVDWLNTAPIETLRMRQNAAEQAFRQLGITFAVYGDEDARERIIPFDIIPRLFSAAEWARLEQGLDQRVRAINAFLNDIYGEQRIIKAGIIPHDLVFSNPQYRSELVGMRPPHDIWAHIAGIDMVRTGADGFSVLEDNVRTPSGVSYMLENREAMIRLCPELFRQMRVATVDGYPDLLHAMMRISAPPAARDNPVCVILTPGQYNSAYYEHSFLADSIGIELVEAADLLVEDDKVWMRSITGLVQVDVIYRRIDDDYLDPEVFRPDSMLGVPGLMRAFRAGNVTLVNAPGTGIADDKAIYSYMPEIVSFYSGSEALLPIVQTWRCREPDACQYVLDHIEDLVVKLVDGSGGYGMLIGPLATKAECAQFRAAIRAQPEKYIAQPTLALSAVPTLTDAGIAPRHVDFRPFVLSSPDGVAMVPGGLTRVALKQGSLVVNSSQGGGTKDTFVLMRDEGIA